MRRIVFYSWQSDLPNASNRGFIQTALEKAAKAIAADESVAVEPVIDRDTAGVPGSPDIAATIFAKIASADVIVSDVSIVSRPNGGRPSPNPNVLIELGYAIRAAGYERVILVFNEAYGKVEELPFDLRARRVIVYEAPEEAKDRAKARAELEARLNSAIRAALEHAPTPEAPTNDAILAIEEAKPNRVLLLRRELAEVLKSIEAGQPKKPSVQGTVEDLIAAIHESQENAARFLKICEMIAAMNDADAAREAYRWFGNLLERYNLPKGFSGTYSEADFDYFKFVGHELFVGFVALLKREDRWELLSELLDAPIPVRYLSHQGGPGNASWSDLSEHIELLLVENSKRHRMSVHADMLKERHSNGGLAAVMPFEEFVDADFFLYLRGELPPEKVSHFIAWRPWSALYLEGSPSFLLRAEQKSFARQLLRALGVASFADFKARLSERVPRLRELFRTGFWRWSMSQEVVEKIGTR